MSVDSEDAFEQGRRARLQGEPVDSNPYFGGGKREAANEMKWNNGWIKEDTAGRPGD